MNSEIVRTGKKKNATFYTTVLMIHCKTFIDLVTSNLPYKTKTLLVIKEKTQLLRTLNSELDKKFLFFAETGLLERRSAD